jgi:hypothetical protein
VKGFVTKMEECMGACDCIITKVCSTFDPNLQIMHFAMSYYIILHNWLLFNDDI